MCVTERGRQGRVAHKRVRERKERVSESKQDKRDEDRLRIVFSLP